LYEYDFGYLWQAAHRVGRWAGFERDPECLNEVGLLVGLRHCMRAERKHSSNRKNAHPEQSRNCLHFHFFPPSP
jgi:hypothetical protein